ncbi:MAG: ribonuclease Y [Ardenticatenaceae bacterium]|nr:ribonuclease Y [Ardenticatenaceae bacterium]HBY96908.1 ribonuclease Y [Chloroflexota bacterium]
MPWALMALALVIGVVIGATALYLYRQPKIDEVERQAQTQADRLLAEAQAEAKQIVLNAKEEAVTLRDEVEAENQQRRRDLNEQERHLQRRREQVDKRQEQLDNQRRKLEQREKQIRNREKRLEEIQAEEETELQRISGLTPEEARAIILERVGQETRQDMARVIREIEMEARETADRRAREIVVTAMQRLATEAVAEVVVSTVPLPSDDMKGRIIGRAGRNIRAIENATGVDLVVDDTPEAVIISSFDPVRREIARVTLTKLVADGRIHPARIEKVVQEAREEVEQLIREAGEQAVYETGVRGLHPDLIKLLGQLKFRTSYGQNQWAHAIEASHIAGMLAAELGADVELARKGALLHDIGKAVTHEVEGPHALIGADICRRCGVNPIVANAIASHHHEEEQQTIEAVIVEIADALSGARPGARRETLEAYIKRIKALEDVAHSFEGVEEAYAIQAGREIRIIVKPDEVDDLAAMQLSKNIARKVEEGLEYPGQIKVTVVRETRAVDYAK